MFLTTQYLEEADQLAGRVGIIDGGRIVAEGTPAALKAEVGDPTLTVSVADPRGRRAARALLGRLRRARSPTARAVAVRLPGGASAVAGVVRALDEAGIPASGLDLAQPSLDDVFVAKTGRRLEARAPRTAAAVAGRR